MSVSRRPNTPRRERTRSPGTRHCDRHATGLPPAWLRVRRVVPQQVIPAEVVQDPLQPQVQIVVVEDGEAARLLRHERERFLGIDQELVAFPRCRSRPAQGTLLASRHHRRPCLRVVFGGLHPGRQSARVDAVDDDTGEIRAVHQLRERVPDSGVAGGVEPLRRRHQSEALGEEHHGFAAWQVRDARDDVLEGVERRRCKHRRAQALDRVFVAFLGRSTPGVRLLSKRILRRYGRERRHTGPAEDRPLHPVGGRVHQAPIGGELLERSHAAGGAKDRHLIPGLHLLVDEFLERVPDGDSALKREAKVVHDHGHHSRGACGTQLGSATALWCDRREALSRAPTARRPCVGCLATDGVLPSGT